MTDEKQNEVSESNEIPHEINSVSDLSQILKKELGEPKEGHTRFFRGHADKDWQMLPGIYRAKHLIENEDKIIKDALTYCPDDFSPSDTLFEKLVKLQHYGYSTRLLDLTTNALVALHFASLPYINPKTNAEEDKDGELIILDIPNEKIKYWDSDTVAILSAISLQNNFTDLDLLVEVAKTAQKTAEDNVELRHKSFLENSSEIEKLTFYKSLKELNCSEKEYKNHLKNQEGEMAFLDNFNKQKIIVSLLHDIRADKYSFSPIINPYDFEQVLCVRAKLNNIRISRQQGCFLLFGINIKDGKKFTPDKILNLINNDWHHKKHGKKIRFIIKSKKDNINIKELIQNELKSFGISKRTLFPELEAQAKEIMDYYKGQK